MSYEFYKVFHLFSLFLFVISVVSSANQQILLRKRRQVLIGAGLLVLTGGFGLLSRLGINHMGPFPNFSLAKMAIILIIIIGCVIFETKKFWSIVSLFLILLALVIVIYRPI